MKKTNQKEALKIWLGVLLLPFVIGAGAVGKRLPNLSKKAITICVAAAMVLSLLPLSTFAEETDEARWVVQTGTDLPDTFTDSGTLEEAMAVANGTEDGAYTYIQLCRDVTVDNYTAVELDYQQYAVLDLGGYTLAATSDRYAYAVENYGTLLVRNGTATASGPSAWAIYSCGCTILESGTFTATRTSNSSYPEDSGYGVFVGMGQFYLGDVTKIEGTDADIFLANDEVLVANDGTATPTYYNGNTLKIATVEPPLPYNDFNPRPYVYHDEILVSGLNSTNKDKFVLVDYDAEFFQTQYDEDNSWLTMEGKPMSLSWLDEDGTVLTGSDYPANAPFAGELSLPAATKTGKEFVGWMYRQADSDFWSNDFLVDYSQVTSSLEAKAVYLYDLTPVTDDTGTYIPIRTAEDLMALSAIINSGYNSDVYNDNSVTYRLMNDLDMSQVCGKDIGSFLPIGNWYSPFCANFDGNGKTISNLYVAQMDNAALFGVIDSDVTIKDLTVSGEFISNRYAYVLFAEADSNLTVSDCTLLGTVRGSVGDTGAYGSCWGPSTFTNLDDSGVTILPPKCYTVTPGNHMAYGQTPYDGFDVIGNYNGQLISTTYGNGGYEYRTDGLADATVSVSGASIGGGRYAKLTYTVTAGQTAVTAGKLAVHADVMVGENDSATVRVIKSGDKVIGISLLDEDEENATCGAQFSLYFADSAGVTNVSTYWFGRYDDRTDYAFENLSAETATEGADYADDYSALYDADSGFAISWKNIALNPGESKSFSLTLGVGEAVDPIVWGDPDVTLSSTTTDDNGHIHVTAKVKDEAGLKDTLFASVDNGAEMQLTTVTAAEGEASATAVLDLSTSTPGEHQVTFWFVNEEGAMTTAVTKTVTVTAPVAGKFQDATPSTNVGAAKPDATAVELEDAVPLTDSEKQAKDRGEDVLTWLEVKDATSTVSAASKETIAKALGSNKKVGMYLDLAMFKKVGDAEAQALTQLNKAISITMKVPTELLPESEAQGRVYYIVRMHNGTVDLLDTTFDAKAGTITFETDRFSDYAIAYSDIVTSPATGDTFSTVLWVTLMAVNAMALAVLLIGKKKEIF